jgi:ribosomal protein S27AE
VIHDDILEWVRRGQIAQREADKLIARLRQCPKCGKSFLPTARSQVYCGRRCRWANAAMNRRAREKWPTLHKVPATRGRGKTRRLIDDAARDQTLGLIKLGLEEGE